MDVIPLLRTIRQHESRLLLQISELAAQDPSLIASYMDVSFPEICELKRYSKQMCTEINNIFTYNTSSLFTIDLSAFTDEALNKFTNQGMNDEFFNESQLSGRYTEEQLKGIEKLRFYQKRIFCTIHELLGHSPSIAISCCGLNPQLIKKLKNVPHAQLMDLIEDFPEFSYIKLRIKKQDDLKNLFSNVLARDAFALYLDVAVC